MNKEAVDVVALGFTRLVEGKVSLPPIIRVDVEANQGEVDIKGYFDNIDHEWMLKMLAERVDDKALLWLIKKWLKAGILDEDGEVIHPVTGYGAEVGEPIVTHPDVRMIAFTGSLATGQRIASLAAPQMKKLHLELGGKDPMVIAPDMDLKIAVNALAYGALINAGKVCISTERVYVHESLFPQLSEELADFVGKLKLGNGLDPGTDIGPMLRDHFRSKVESQIRQAVASGAKVLTGGKRPEGFEKGF